MQVTKCGGKLSGDLASLLQNKIAIEFHSD